MRPIKYRAWDNKKHFWLNPEYFYVTGEGRGFTCEHSKGMYSDSYELMGTNRYTIIQFTGLLDKNGKEIYEGDIVRHKAGDVWVVKFEYRENEGWAWNGYNCFVKSEWGLIEVIGNIHESPELIEETKCDKCGSPDVYKEWDNVKLCRICFEDLEAEARTLTEPNNEESE